MLINIARNEIERSGYYKFNAEQKRKIDFCDDVLTFSLIGAAAGAFAGPLGAIIGAVVGAVSGIFIGLGLYYKNQKDAASLEKSIIAMTDEDYENLLDIFNSNPEKSNKLRDACDDLLKNEATSSQIALIKEGLSAIQK